MTYRFKIKRFNENVDSIYQYYEIIPYGDYCAHMEPNQLNDKISEKEFKILSEFGDISAKSTDRSICYFFIKDFKKAENFYKLNIYKKEDEWFFVNVYNFNKANNVRYKCDQFDGLIKLIKGKYNEKINENKNEEYYIEINKDDYINAVHHNIYIGDLVDITPHERQILYKYKGKIEVDSKYNHRFWLNGIQRFNIYKRRDDWFYVSIADDVYYYKCDKIDGLVKLIEYFLEKYNSRRK